jgi:hypothetical protein
MMNITWNTLRSEMHTKFWSKNLKGSLKRGWEGNIRIDRMEIGWKGTEWIHLAQDRNQWRAVYRVMNFRVL